MKKLEFLATFKELCESGVIELKVDMSDGRSYYASSNSVVVNVKLKISGEVVCESSDSFTVTIE